MTIGDAIKAGEIISERMDPKANIKWGARLIPGYDDQIEIVAIVAGAKGSSIAGRLEDKQRRQQPFSDLELVG
jgi:cell division protein FtsZ